MKYPSIKFSEVHRDWEVDVNSRLTICIDVEEFPGATEAVMQAMLWNFYIQSHSENKRGAK